MGDTVEKIQLEKLIIFLVSKGIVSQGKLSSIVGISRSEFI